MRSHYIIFRFWLTYVAGMVCFGWILSYLDSYHWMVFVAVPLLAFAAFRFFQSWENITADEKQVLRGDLKFPPFLILLGLIALAGCLYTTAVLDSLSYRIPRVQIWLQEGGVFFVDTADARLNFMTPIWEFASTPLYQTSCFRLLWLGSAISWIMLYLAFVFLSRRLGASQCKARWLAMIPAASVGFVLQAPSTMNDIWAMAFTATSLAFIVGFEEEREFKDLLSSGLALALAAGTKPHYAVLALPWILWFLFSKSRPFVFIRWKWTVPAACLALLCSPLPTFISNHIHYGNFKGGAGDGGFGMGSWWINLVFGSTQMVWQIFQPPINPWAKSLEAQTTALREQFGIEEMVPRFSLAARELSLVDSASIGLCGALILLIGTYLAFRRKPAIPRWALYASLAGVTGFLIAVSQVVPGTLGRSFLGFTVLVFPLGIAGLLKLQHKYLIGLCALNTIVGTVALAVSPSHPLLPIKTLSQKSPKLGNYLKPYFAFQQRAEAGAALLNKLPVDVNQIGILSNGDQNLIHLWRSGKHPRSVTFYPKKVTLDELYNSPPAYIVMAGSVAGDYLELKQEILEDPRFEQIESMEFQTKNERGPETWLLFHKRPGRP